MKQKIVVKELPVFDIKEINRIIGTDIERYGFTLYRNNMIIWDEDYDSRIIAFADDLAEYHEIENWILYENQGTLRIFWSWTNSGVRPEGIFDKGMVELSDGDTWMVEATCMDEIPF